MTTNHTPTPWRIETSDGEHFILPPKGNADPCIASINERPFGRLVESAHANAAFIVRAVNAHDALVEALEAAEAHLEFTGYGDRYERECAGNLSERIQSALKLANGNTDPDIGDPLAHFGQS